MGYNLKGFLIEFLGNFLWGCQMNIITALLCSWYMVVFLFIFWMAYPFLKKGIKVICKMAKFSKWVFYPLVLVLEKGEAFFLSLKKKEKKLRGTHLMGPQITIQNLGDFSHIWYKSP